MFETATQLASVGLPVFPCRDDKNPAVDKGVSWKNVATLNPQSLHWPSSKIGVPIPQGAVVIDLDTYKGATRQQVEQALGCTLPWDLAFIQRTQGGGEHYAFAVDWPVRFGSNLMGITGLDTRTAGKGYICTGAEYPWVGFGPARMSQPATMLPRLPDATRHLLEHVQREVTATDLPQGDRDIDLIREALGHINADCSRSEWVAVGMALKHHFHDTQDVGFALFKEWSEYAADRLDYETLEPQWESFKVFNTDGASLTIATVMYTAMQAGWVPPSDIDTALAFGTGAASVEVFGALVDRISATGGDPKATGDLIDAVKGTACSDIQRATLLATMHRELKEAGLLTKAVRAALDSAVTGQVRTADTAHNAPGRYGKNHTENAVMFLESAYPDGMLLRSDDVWYSYDGRCWIERSDEDMQHELFRAMMGSFPQDSTINGTYGLLRKMCHSVRKIGRVPHNLIIYLNGVLDVNNWVLSPHTPEHFTTNILPYDYVAGAFCPHWLAFVAQIFEDDGERIALLQEWLGYQMVTSYRHHKIMLLLGPSRSGKGTIGRMLGRIAGAQNFSGGSLHAFPSDKFIESLRTKPVMFIGDAEGRVSRNQISQTIERIKTISGNDAITFNRLYKPSLTETLPTRITIASNNTPQLFDDSGALAGRFLVLPINITFADREDLTLFDTLCGEIEGIAAWALAGLHRLNTTGQFTHPQASRDEKQYLTEAYSPLAEFVAEACIEAPEEVVLSLDMYEAYKAWAVLRQEDRVLARKTFIGALKDATRGQFRYGTHRIGAKIERGFKGVQLRGVNNYTAAAFAPPSTKDN